MPYRSRPRVQLILVVSTFLLLGITIFFCATHLRAQTRRQPNILVIMGDGIGWYNTSIYNRGDMGYQTPNIDRIGKEGAMFTS